MSAMEIQLGGRATAYRPAERCVLIFHTRSNPVQNATEADNAVASVLNTLCDAIAPFCSHDTATDDANEKTAITYYSVTTHETARGKDRSNDSSMSFSKRSSYETTYTAYAEVTIEFRDFALLARLATQTGSMENVKIKSVEWMLTPASQAALEDEACKEASRNALRRARNYAEVFTGLSVDEATRRVRAITVKESKLYEKVTRSRQHSGMKHSGNIQKSEWDYKPLDVGVEVQVDGKFLVVEA